MDLFKTVVDIISDILAVLVLVLAGLGFAFKTAISSWISTRFQRGVSKELEHYRHTLSQQLEAYKASVMRELEEFKANIDIRRAIALQHASAKLDAQRRVTSALDLLANLAVSYPCYAPAARAGEYNEVAQAFSDARQAFRNAEPFLDLAFNGEIASLMSSAWQLISDYHNSQEVLTHEHPRVMDVLRAGASVGLKLRQQIADAGRFG